MMSVKDKLIRLFARIIKRNYAKIEITTKEKRKIVKLENKIK